VRRVGKKSKRITKRERTAYHEAAHAVVAFYCNLVPKTRHVTIVPDEDTAGHHKSYKTPSFHPGIDVSPRAQVRVQEEIQVCLAGNIAVKKLTGRYEHKLSSNDMKRAVDYALSLAGSSESAGKLVEWLWVCTEDGVNRWWPIIQKVAQCLLEHETLVGEELRQVIQRAENELVHELRDTARGVSSVNT